MQVASETGLGDSADNFLSCPSSFPELNKDVQSISELNKDADGNLLGKEIPSIRFGQLDKQMVKALSAQLYHPVFHQSQGSGINTLPSDAKGNTKYNQIELQRQVAGNNNIEFGSGLSRDKQQMVKALSAEPYHPAFPISQDAGSSSYSQHCNVVNQISEFQEHYGRVYPTHPPLRSSIGANITFMAPHAEESNCRESVSFADHPNVQEMDFGGDSNVDMPLIHDVSSATSSTGVANSLNKGASPLSLVKGHVAGFCVDQFGSRYIQENIATATPEEKAMVLTEIIPHVAELVMNAFGNYVIQKFMEYGAPDHRRILIECLTGNVFTLSCHMYGCRVIERAIEIGDLDQKVRLAKELNGFILRCIHDQNANHIVQKCIEHVPQQHIQFIFKNMYGHVAELSTHLYGCRIIEKIFEHCDHPSVQRLILSEIMEQLPRLARDQFGNYIVQDLLKYGNPPLRSSIIKMFVGRFMAMSQGKFSSNVIEKCLTYGSLEERQMIINEMLTTGGEIEALAVMLDDPYANYVLKKVIETCEDWQRRMILGCLNTHFSTLSHHKYWRYIIAHLEKLIRAGEC
ncbi:hypothetical protein BS78_08G114100 [Paspalum vaginatum]|nr:hypothetical protein BS78_08G114100 [Paspalum vaginatum]